MRKREKRSKSLLTDQEDPFPSGQARITVHALMNRRHHHTGKHASGLAYSGENGSPLRDFLRFTVTQHQHPHYRSTYTF